MEEISGNTPDTQVYQPVNGASLVEQLKAESKQLETALFSPKPPEPPTAPVPAAPAPATTSVQEQTPATPAQEKAPVEGNTPDGLQKFRNKDGDVDLAKIEKSNEHLQ